MFESITPLTLKVRGPVCEFPSRPPIGQLPPEEFLLLQRTDTDILYALIAIRYGITAEDIFKKVPQSHAPWNTSRRLQVVIFSLEGFSDNEIAQLFHSRGFTTTRISITTSRHKHHSELVLSIAKQNREKTRKWYGLLNPTDSITESRLQEIEQSLGIKRNRIFAYTSKVLPHTKGKGLYQLEKAVLTLYNQVKKESSPREERISILLGTILSAEAKNILKISREGIKNTAQSRQELPEKAT